ncbi:unnamed protein product [Miscanthus lutarioriparius]|uniref:Uncharacterized protein n=1 Tax=Miscanthus lutarioriparius TaxID=422564 RepID=A0A811QYR9_9POAL|nr:unnamed protein product [Miscanthus lutarioriparius]
MSAEPKEMPLKRAEEPSSPSSEDVGAQGSGEERTEEDEAEGSGGASPARGLLPDDSADAGHNKRGATPKRGEKRSPPPRQGDERPEKRAVGPAGETVAASAPRRKKKSKRSAEKDRRKKKKKKQLRKALTKPKLPPQLLELELNDDREDTPSLPDIAQEDEHNGRETAEQEQEQSSTSPPEVEHRAREEEQQEKKIIEQEHASDTSPPHDKDMHIVHGEQQQEKEVANQEHADDTSPPKDNHREARDKIRKLRTRYRKILVQGCRMFKLSEILWGQVDEDERVEPTSRDFSVLSKLYPHLAKEVKAYAETHSSGDLIMAMFMTIGDEKARDLDAKCKKQQIEAFKLELGQASLINELLSALSSLTCVKF